jgi:hypothetical protein
VKFLIYYIIYIKKESLKESKKVGHIYFILGGDAKLTATRKT